MSGHPNVEPSLSQCVVLMFYSPVHFKQDVQAGWVCSAKADRTEEQDRKDPTGKNNPNRTRAKD